MDTRKQQMMALLGSLVHVEVDRPIGYQHGDLRYPVNYGYIPGRMAGDGEEQDVYVLGVEEPRKTFTGRIIGVVRRKDDNEDKLVAAPEDIRLTSRQILEKIHFVEKYFDSSVFSIYD